jgi:hypothetical protein
MSNIRAKHEQAAAESALHWLLQNDRISLAEFVETPGYNGEQVYRWLVGKRGEAHGESIESPVVRQQSNLAETLELLRSLLEQAVAHDPWATADSTRNVLLYPATQAQTRNDVLAHRQGGLVTDASLRPRVSVIVGPGATLRGIADRLLPLYAAATSAQAAMAPPTVDELAKGILVYNQYYLAVPLMSNYYDGLRLLLPIEIDQTNGDWVLNSNLIRTWSGIFQAAWQPALDQRPGHLTQPDSVTLNTEVQTFLTAQPTTLQRAIHLQARAMTNSFEAVFFVFEAFRQLGANAFEVALEFMNQSVNHQVQLLATLTAGNAILRRLKTILDVPPPNLPANQQANLNRAGSMLSQSLGLGATLTVPRELPETAQQLANRPGGIGAWQHIQPDDPAGGNHRMVLGRDVLAGAIGTFTQTSGAQFRGAAYGGRISPAQFIQANQALLNPTNNQQLAARLEIVQAIAVNEGFLDAVRMRDRGILSIGMQQWSAHANLELPALLWRFKQMAPAEFILYFSLYNLEIRQDGQDGHGNPTFMLQQVQPNGAVADLTTQQQRISFFGGATAGNLTTFRTDWAARARESSVASPTFRAAQILEAAARLDRVLREVGNITVGGNPTPLDQLITSQLGVALILDAHINMPALVRNDLQAAANAVGPQPNADALDQAITNQYMTIRHTHNTPARNANINALGLNAGHGSFAGW